MIPGLVSNLIFCLSVHPIALWTVIWINIFLSISQFWLDLSDAKICLGYQTHFVKRIFLLIFPYGKGHWLLLKTRSKTLSCGINNLLQILQYINYRMLNFGNLMSHRPFNLNKKRRTSEGSLNRWVSQPQCVVILMFCINTAYNTYKTVISLSYGNLVFYASTY